jgi:RNA polymerase subunit RPABC4/transcription elongation factor Spt4
MKIYNKLCLWLTFIPTCLWLIHEGTKLCPNCEDRKPDFITDYGADDRTLFIVCKKCKTIKAAVRITYD